MACLWLLILYVKIKIAINYSSYITPGQILQYGNILQYVNYKAIRNMVLSHIVASLIFTILFCKKLDTRGI